MRVLRAADRVETPWRNGGGVTAEVHAAPCTATLESFDWRVSLARIARDGPFSRFEGVERRLLVLESTLQLEIADVGACDLETGSPPFVFSGAAEVLGRVAGAPAHVLNLMARGSRRIAMGRRTLSTSWRAGFDDGDALVLALGRVGLAAGAAPSGLEPLDALVLAPGEFVGLEPCAPAEEIIVIEIGPAAL